MVSRTARRFGNRFLINVEDAFDDIRRSPESYAVVYRDVRQAFVQRFPYVICFVADSATVTIISVFHRKPRPDRLETSRVIMRSMPQLGSRKHNSFAMV